MRKIFPILASLIAVLVLTMPPATAQSLASGLTGDTTKPRVDLSDPLTATQAEALVSRLSDTEVRKILLEQLGTKAAAGNTADGGLGDFFFHATTGAFQSILVPIQRVPQLISGQARAFSNFFDTFGVGSILQFIAIFLGVLLVALAVEYLFPAGHAALARVATPARGRGAKSVGHAEIAV